MSTALLQELHQEIRRLYIAGSELAAGDFRLKRLLPQFQQLGERAPVFKKLGEGVAAILEPDTSGGTPPGVQLQELTLLLESVLYTQGTTAVNGTPGPLPVRSFTLQTIQPYRKIAPVQQALTTTGSGRYEIVLDAYKEGIFGDLRLLPLAVAALKDPYSELAEYAMTHIVPSYGPEIAGYLFGSFNPAGGRGEVRKLEVIGKVAGEEYLEEIFKAAESGSEEVRVAAIKWLAGHEQYVASLLEWSTDKKKAIREAAFSALAAGGSQQGAERLVETFTAKKDRDLVAAALAQWPFEAVSGQLAVLFLQELQQAPQKNLEKAHTNLIWNEIMPFLKALSQERNPQLDEIYSYVISEYSRFASLGWMPLIDRAASYKQDQPTAAELKELQELEKQNYRYLPNYFLAAQQLLTPKELFNQFGETLLNKLASLVRKEAKDTAERTQMLIQTVEDQMVTSGYKHVDAPWDPSSSGRYYTEMLSVDQLDTSWDPRWLDWFIKHDAVNLVSAFARPGHSGVTSYLIGKLQEPSKRRNNHYVPGIFRGLERAGMPEPERLDLLMMLLEGNKIYNPYVFDYYLFELMQRFPASYTSRLEAITPKYKYECKQQLEFLVNSLRSAQ